jgi:hypothetical protein
MPTLAQQFMVTMSTSTLKIISGMPANSADEKTFHAAVKVELERRATC